VAEQSESKASWLARRREQKRLKRERTGDSAEKGHTPQRDVMDKWVHSGGIQRRSRFKK
jgi:hypothetical protein